MQPIREVRTRTDASQPREAPAPRSDPNGKELRGKLDDTTLVFYATNNHGVAGVRE
jgi:hypothetical protein